MKLVPVMTEKSLKDTKKGGFTFWMVKTMNKYQIKAVVEKAFGVHVVSVKTVNSKAGKKRNVRGQVQKIKGAKKAVVFLKEGEKIGLFEEEKKKKTTKKKGTK